MIIIIVIIIIITITIMIIFLIIQMKIAKETTIKVNEIKHFKL